VFVGLASSDTYMKLAKEEELQRQSRRNKKAVSKHRTSKSGKRRKHGAVVVDDDQDEDIPVMHVVSTAIDAPEVLAAADVKLITMV